MLDACGNYGGKYTSSMDPMGLGQWMPLSLIFGSLTKMVD